MIATGHEQLEVGKFGGVVWQEAESGVLELAREGSQRLVRRLRFDRGN